MPGRGPIVPYHRRNPRRSYDSEGRQILPMDLTDAMQNGVRALRAICNCGHEAEVPIDGWQPETYVPDVGLSLRYTDCGRRGPKTEPMWPRRDGA